MSEPMVSPATMRDVLTVELSKGGFLRFQCRICEPPRLPRPMNQSEITTHLQRLHHYGVDQIAATIAWASYFAGMAWAEQRLAAAGAPGRYRLAPLHTTEGAGPHFPGSHPACWHLDPPKDGDLGCWICCWCDTVRFVPGEPLADATGHGIYLPEADHAVP